jgi:DNA polymerase III subunit delta'
MAKKPSKPAKTRSRPPREIEVKPERRLPVQHAAAPISLDSLLGQDRAITSLRSAIKSGRIHHAWIFHGPAGVGKFTAALAFAATILDPSTGPGLSGQIEPDPDSPTQRLLRAGTHPDLHIITKELAEVSREQRIRDSKQKTIARDVLEEFLVEPAARTRNSGEEAMASKVFIVDEAELMDRFGQNILLKTLEEPPPGSVIVLITSNEERLLPTIRSRCQPVAFAPLGEADMKRWLDRSKLDLSSLSPEARRWLLSFADGSPGAATLALETGLTQWYAALAPMLAELDAGRYPIDLGTAIAKLIDEWAIAAVDRSGSDTASKDAANKSAARLMFRLLGDHFRQRLRTAAARNTSEAVLERDLAAIDQINEAERQFDASVQGIFVFDNLAAGLVSRAP